MARIHKSLVSVKIGMMMYRLPATRSLFIWALFFAVQVYGQQARFFKTTARKDLHYIEFRDKLVHVYRMGTYFDKGGSGPAILLKDTLVMYGDPEYKGKHYSLTAKGEGYLLMAGNGKKLEAGPDKNVSEINARLNHAYCLRSYRDLSKRLNDEFPLNYYSYRSGFYAWQEQGGKTEDHDQFVDKMNLEIATLYDSISAKQRAFTRTMEYVTQNAARADYAVLRDSIATLPVDYRPQSKYFDRSVYEMSKANPEFFYRLLQDFPASRDYIYSAVDSDKELITRLKQVPGYEDLKREFLKQHREMKTLGLRVVATYAIFAGLIALLIIVQP